MGVVKTFCNCIFRVLEFRTNNYEVHGTRLKRYGNSRLYKKSIILHVLSFVTDMSAAPLLLLADQDRNVFVAVQ